MSDFNILIGVDMRNAENEIKDSIKKIGTDYPLKLEAIISNKDSFIKELHDIQTLFKSIGNIDMDFGLKEGSKELEHLKTQMKGLNNIDISDVGKELANSLDDAKKKIEAVRQAYANLMKVTDKKPTDGFETRTTKSGHKFSNVTEKRAMKDKDGALINDGNGKLLETNVNRDFDALSTYVDKAMQKIELMTNVTSKYSDEISGLAIRLANLHKKLANGDESFSNEIKAINNLMERYNKLEDEMTQATKVRETQAKEAIKWANKLAEVERNGFANPASKKKMGRLVGELDGDFKSLDELQKKLNDISIQYTKIQGQEKAVSFQRKVNDEHAKLDKNILKKGKIDAKYVDPNDGASLLSEITSVKHAETNKQLEDAIKRVNRLYNEMLAKQAKAIELEKEQAQQVEDIARLQQHLLETENERAKLAHEAKASQWDSQQHTGLVNDKSDAINQMKSKMVGSGLIDAKAFDEIETRLVQLSHLAKSEHLADFDIVDKGLQDVDKMVAKITDRYTDLDTKARQIMVSTHNWNKEINQIKSNGFVNDGEFDNVRKSIQGLRAESESFNGDLKRVEQQMRRMATVSDLRNKKQESMDVTRYQNNNKIDDMSSRGIVPQSFLDNFKGLNNMLDFSSSKADIAVINRDMQQLVQLEADIKAAYKDDAKIRELIAQAELNLLKSTDRYMGMIDEIVHNSTRQLNNEESLNVVKQKALEVENLINQAKERGAELSYAETKAIQDKIVQLKREAQVQRDIQSEQNARSNTIQRVTEKFDSNSYRATRGFGDDSKQRRELQTMIDNIKSQVDGLQFKFGDDFVAETKKIEEAMNGLNEKSAKLREIDRKDRNSTTGQLQAALKKVPVWLSAATLVYGTMSQIRQGFQYLLDVDKAMISLQKVSEASGSELNQFKETASSMGKELGVLATDIIMATTEFQRLGYSLQQATALGKNSILYANVGDMSINDASAYLISTIKGFGIQVDTQGNNVRRLVDMFNEVGNNFAISSQGIGEALKRSSSVMKEAGNTIEESVGLVTSANAVIQDPAKVGTALKTIAMRLRGVSEDGTNVKELVPKLETTFKRINKEFNLLGDNSLTLMQKDGTTFKSTYQILEQISGVWSKLTDLERANIVETIGGKEQGVVVSAIIQNWKDAKDAAETASSSAGSAQREFSAYMDGFEYRIGQLKNSLEKFWMTLIDSNAVKSAISFLTSVVDTLTQLTNAIGGTPILAIVTSLIGLLGSKGLREVVAGEGIAKGLTLFEGLTTWGGKLLSLVPRFLGFVGVIYAIGAAVESVYKFIYRDDIARKERLKTLDQEIAAYEKSAQAYKKIFNKDMSLDTFGKLQDKGSNRTIEEEQKYLSVINEITQTMPELISHYDDHNAVVIKSSEEIKKLREEQEKLNLARKVESFNETLKTDKFSSINDQLSKVKDTTGKVSEFSGGLKLHSVAKEYIQNEMQVLKADGSNYLEVVTAFNDKLLQTINTMPEDEKVHAKQYVAPLQRIVPSSKDKNQMLKNIDNLTKTLTDAKKEYDKQYSNLRDSINGSQDFATLLDSAFNIEMSKRNIDTKSNDFVFLQQLKDNMAKNVDLFGSNVKEIAGNIPKYIDEAFNKLKDKGITVDNLLRIDPEKVKENEAIIDDIMGSLDKTKHGKALIEFFQNIKTSYVNAANEMSKNPIKPFLFDQEVLPDVNNFINAISDLDSAYRTLADGQDLSLATTMSLATKHPELIKNMQIENNVLKLTQEGIKAVAKLKEDEFRRSLQIDKDKAESARQKSQDIIDGILKEAKANSYLDDVRSKGVAQAIKEAEAQRDRDFAMGAPDALENYSNKIVVLENLQKEYKSLEENQGSIDAIKKLLDQDWTSQLGNINNNKDSNKQVQVLQDNIYVVDEYKRRIDFLNQSIENQQKLQANSAKWSESYRNALNEEIYLTNEKKKAIDAEVASLTSQIEANRFKKTGLIDLTQKDDTKKTAQANQADIQQEIDKSIDRLHQLQSESAQVDVKLNELRWNTVDSTTALYDIQKEMMTDDIAYQEYAMGLYDQSSQAYRDHAQEKLALTKEQMGYDQQSLALLEEEQRSNTNLTEKQIADLNALIREKRKSVLDMAKSVTDIENIIANSRFEEMMYRMTSETEKYAEKIQEVQDKMKIFDLTNEPTQKDFNQHFSEQISFLKEIAALQKGEGEDIRKNIDNLKKKQDEYKDNKDMLEKTTAEIKNQEKALRDNESAVKDTAKSIRGIYEKFADEYVNLYKQQIDLMRQADEKYYKDKQEAEQKAHDQKMKLIDTELKALQDSYDKQMKIIDRGQASKSYTDDTQKMIKDINELKKQIDILSMDDSYEAKAKKADLVKQLTEKQIELSQKQNDREIELRKNDLQDNLDTEKEKLDTRKTKYDEDFKNFSDNLQKESEASKKHWDDMLNDERKFAELRQQVFDGKFNEMLATVQTWSKDVGSHVSDLGQTITDNFTDKVKGAIKALEELKYKNPGSFSLQVPNTKPNNVDGEKKQSTRPPVSSFLSDKDKVAEMKLNSKEWSNADKDTRKFLEDRNKELGDSIKGAENRGGEWYKDGKLLYEQFKTGGYTGDWSGTDGKLALLDKKELVLNSDQTQHILDTARIVERIKSIIPNLNIEGIKNKILNILPKASEPATVGNTEHNEYHIEVTVQGNADKNVADTVADSIVSKIKRTKGGRF